MRKISLLLVAAAAAGTFTAPPASAAAGGQCDATYDVNCWYYRNGRREQCDLWISGSCYIDVTGNLES